ncbi:MAG: phosphonate C-P lyase system protein PhnL [Xanthobacteraceae bacterium]|nr:phosphonate C-P lyase system protein PhnL [Xanthobacteraceae bacterium]
MSAVIDLIDVRKSFTMHLQGGLRLPVVAGVTFSARPGECVALAGPSGIGKSSILKMIFGNYRCDGGRILLSRGDQVTDIATAAPRAIIALRRHAMAYVSQFLRAVPRVAALDIVAEPLLATGIPREEARRRAAAMLSRLHVPERLWPLPPATFSGGEQQRVNIARGFLPEMPLLLLDEPTASLDADNRAAVVALIAEKKRRGAAIVSIMHDEDVRNAVADRSIDVSQFAAAA